MWFCGHLCSCSFTKVCFFCKMCWFLFIQTRLTIKSQLNQLNRSIQSKFQKIGLDIPKAKLGWNPLKKSCYSFSFLLAFFPTFAITLQFPLATLLAFYSQSHTTIQNSIGKRKFQITLFGKDHKEEIILLLFVGHCTRMIIIFFKIFGTMCPRLYSPLHKF